MQTIDFEKLHLKPDQCLLDLGAGEGRHAISAHYYQTLNTVAVDLCADDLNTAWLRFRDCFGSGVSGSFSLVQANALTLPFADDSFDIIICSEVLEHIPDYHQVLKEIERLLKPGGQLAVSVPRFGPERICWWLCEAYHQVEGGHIRIFKSKELKTAIEQTGFLYQQQHYQHALHAPYWWLKCLFWHNTSEPIIVRLYHRFLVWDLMKKPFFTRMLDTLLNPLMGKSVVMYFNKHNASTKG